MAKTFTLVTDTAEVIDYNDIKVEVGKTVDIPAETKVIKTVYTVRKIKEEIDSLNDQITALTALKQEREQELTKVVVEADKVTNARNKSKLLTK